MDKNSKYLIIGCIVIVLILFMGLAYMQQGTQDKAATPTPAAAPSATATAAPTTAPGSAPTYEVNGSTAATLRPIITLPSVTPTPTSEPVPSNDPYSAPGWPHYNKQYGPAQPMGTITAHIEDWEEKSEGDIEYIMENVKAGVLPGSYGTWPDFMKKTKLLMIDVPMPETWTPIGADGNACLGEFEYGNYTVYCRIGGEFTMWQSIEIDDSHRDWIVNFPMVR